MLPVANNPEVVLPKLKVQANEVCSTLLDNTFDFKTVKLAVKKHQDRQRYEAIEAEENENIDFPDSAVYHKNHKKALLDLSTGHGNAASFPEENSSKENGPKVLQTGGWCYQARYISKR